MRILVRGIDIWANVGDISMQLVTIERLRELWPEIIFEIITAQSDQMAHYIPDAKCLIAGEDPRQQQRLSLKNLLRKWLPSRARRNLVLLQNSFSKRRSFGQAKKSNNKFSAAINQADAVIMSGAGVITDAFLGPALERLNLLEEAIHAGKTTAIFGQAIGPIEQPHLMKRVKAVLPKINLVCLREQYNSLPLLTQCGIEPSRIIVTGDDAIEMAYSRRVDTLGHHIGVNLRIALYSDLSSSESSIKANLRAGLFAAANQHNISLIPIPIDLSDRRSIRELLQLHDNIEYPANTPWQIIEEIKRCRVVVTGSYHAAVFALSQGISAICLAKAAYYVHKFSGLADQFGEGCEVLFLDDAQLKEKLQTALENSLQNAQKNRPKLLQKAQLQIQTGRHAYQRFYDLVERNVSTS